MYVAFESELFDNKKEKWVMRIRSNDGTYQIIESPVQAALINYRNDFFVYLNERNRLQK
jgi:uncharacterized protein YjbK